MTESRRESSGLIGKIQTVLGPIPSESLGATMTHEHLLVDLSPPQKPPVEASRRGVFYAPLTMDLLGRINFGGHVNQDTSRLVDVDPAIGEAMIYRRAGGQTIVEATSIGIGRDPEGLRKVAIGTGLNIVMGASYYLASSHPPDMDARSEDDIVAEIVRDVVEGVGRTGIRSGAIGDASPSHPLTATSP